MFYRGSISTVPHFFKMYHLRAKSILAFCFVICFFATEVTLDQSSKELMNKYFNVCHRSDVNVNECIRKGLEKLKPFLKTGIPELSIPSFEPLVIPEITLNQGKVPIALHTMFKDVHLFGLSQFEIKSFHSRFETNEMTLQLFFPNLVSKSRYKIEGKILLLPIYGEGLSNATFTNAEGTTMLRGRIVRENKNTFYQIDEVAIDLGIEYMQVYLDKLFDGDEALGNAMNVFLNDNWEVILKDMKPVLEEGIGDIVKDIFNGIFSKFPLEEILPL